MRKLLMEITYETRIDRCALGSKRANIIVDSR